MNRTGPFSWPTVLSLVFFLLPGSAQGQSVADLTRKLEQLQAYPDLIVINSKISTMDERLTKVEAMAVKNSRILALGTDDEIRFLAGPNTEVLDARGRTVLPGLIDSHTHPHAWAFQHFANKYDPQLEITYLKGRAEDIARALAPAIEKRAQELGPNKWIVIHIPRSMGFTSYARRVLQNVDPIRPRSDTLVGENILITRAELDAMAPNNPVVVFASALGGSVTNTQAKEVMEATVGVELASLRLWYFLPYDIVLRSRLADIEELLKAEMIECNARYGITTVVSHIEPLQVIRALNRMDRIGEMPIRWAWVHRAGFSLAKDPAEFYRLLGDSRGQGSDSFWNIGVGSEGWDKSFCTTAVAKDPKLQAAQENPESPCNILESRDYVAHLEALKSGLRITYMHAFRDKALDFAFELADQAMREGQITLDEIRENRTGFDHGALVRPDQISKLARYGIWMNFQTVYTWEFGKDLVQEYGEQYLKWLTPTKSLLDGGARFVLSTDAHITRLDEELEYDAKILDWPWGNGVWPFVGSFVHREINGKVWGAEEKLDRITVLKAYTNWAAEYVLRDQDLGSLEMGKLADFIVIDKDYFTVPEKEIDRIQTLLTVVGGKTVYRSPQF